MNLFLLSWDIDACAKAHVDKHVIKMILEIAQVLSTAVQEISPGPDTDAALEKKLLYRKTHVRHPVAIWVREHPHNYKFALRLGYALCDEYTFRYNKQHKTKRVLDYLAAAMPSKWDLSPETIAAARVGPHKVTPPPQVMPEMYRHSDPIAAYRAYYSSSTKEHLHAWRKRKSPEWVVGSRGEDFEPDPETGRRIRKQPATSSNESERTISIRT